MALVLVSPALVSGRQLDDHVLSLLARDDPGIAGLHSNPLLLFSFTSGRAEDNRALMDQGALLPWWSDPHHLNAFFRPLSSLTHLLDFALWPNSAVLMHAQSLAWFAALLLVVAHLYRRIAGAAPGALLPALAFLIFAFDDTHGMTVAWIANRNALVAATLALPALAAHHRWLALGFGPGKYLGPLCFALGLCAGETAIAVFGYLLAYTVVLDRAPLLRRLLHVAPYVALLVLFRLAFGALSLGAAGSAGYHDPGRDPLAYAFALVRHLPVLLSAQLTVPLADVWFWSAPGLHLPIWLWSMAALLALLALAHRLLAHDPEARFWLVGMVLSGCAVAASVPGERLLLVPSVGAAPLLAAIIAKLASSPNSGVPKGVHHVALFLLTAWHVVLAPIGLPLRAWQMNVLGDALDRADHSVPESPELARQTLVVLNAPFDVMVSYLQITREARGAQRPAHLYWLATASSELTVERIDAHTLRVRPEHGYLYNLPERHYRGDPAGLEPGASVVLSEMTVRIESALPDGRPQAAQFRFAAPLESPRYRFVQFSAGRLQSIMPPAIGQRLRLPRVDFFGTVLAEMFGPEPAAE